ncbi:hypothetical protein NEOLEDRAFT_707029 [Neolentinus lepideus HHB14362 ss-1]|uniref:Uncharacterized protein n=1 Tax=Neolentinus lepideus HHB14362 ss-1 TaxID=1314782 RepID=A0A165Q6J4_9AGAM|nr:hypothetical protein NEOLEDRAFT_707029 [Neolentinus lepideus HHB14362 ss-1]
MSMCGPSRSPSLKVLELSIKQELQRCRPRSSVRHHPGLQKRRPIRRSPSVRTFSVFNIDSSDCPDDKEVSYCSPTSSPLNSLVGLDSVLVSIPFSSPFIPYTPTHFESRCTPRSQTYSDSKGYQKALSLDSSSASPLESPGAIDCGLCLVQQGA